MKKARADLVGKDFGEDQLRLTTSAEEIYWQQRCCKNVVSESEWK